MMFNCIRCHCFSRCLFICHCARWLRVIFIIFFFFCFALSSQSAVNFFQDIFFRCMPGSHERFSCGILVISFCQVGIDIPLKAPRVVIKLRVGASDKCKNSCAGIVQDTRGCAKCCGPFPERTFFFQDDFFCATINAARNFINIKIHRKCGCCNLHIQRIEGVY
ncbi:hypothetical protein C4A16_04770 [Escherichia coli]|nr:hypothetical protein C4A16_04770 [Escherichia coli]RDR15504.1 hypothetical protein C4A17_04743 [Escherichia coli]GCN99055.1 hypothetical protein ExPECSC006_04383 [Escherichia coli]GCS33834.1 hypothetical protein HmCmsJML017_03750 [Escherichia coli]GCT44841.1 hypothetical protein HmCms148_03510 [Escherichia coli]